MHSIALNWAALTELQPKEFCGQSTQTSNTSITSAGVIPDHLGTSKIFKNAPDTLHPAHSTKRSKTINLKRSIMISVAIQKGNFVYVKNEKNSQTACITGELMGYTSSTITVKRGNFAYTFDEKGSQKSCNSIK